MKKIYIQAENWNLTLKYSVESIFNFSKGACVYVCVWVLPVRQYGYAFQAFSWMLRAEAGANILTNDGTLLQNNTVKKNK